MTDIFSALPTPKSKPDSNSPGGVEKKATPWSGANIVGAPPKKRQQSAAPASGATATKVAAATASATAKPQFGLVAYEPDDDDPAPEPEAPEPVRKPKEEPTDEIDEYDPKLPNSYDDYKKKQKAAEELKLEERERERRVQEAKRFEEEQGADDKTLTPEEVRMRRLLISGMRIEELPTSLPAPTGAAEEVQEDPKDDFAKRLLKKAGWKEGGGLGKDGQGIAKPLIHKKVNDNIAKIEMAPDLFAPPPPVTFAAPLPPKPKAVKKLRGIPGPVILLQNMTEPADMDEDLIEETKQECSEKFGEVVAVRYIMAKDQPPLLQCRLFVKFVRIADAVKAVTDLDGRQFGGRRVVAGFFSTTRFEHEALEPDPADPPLPEDFAEELNARE